MWEWGSFREMKGHKEVKHLSFQRMLDMCLHFLPTFTIKSFLTLRVVRLHVNLHATCVCYREDKAPPPSSSLGKWVKVTATQICACHNTHTHNQFQESKIIWINCFQNETQFAVWVYANTLTKHKCSTYVTDYVLGEPALQKKRQRRTLQISFTQTIM